MKPVLIVGEGQPRARPTTEPLSRQIPRIAELAGVTETDVRRVAIGLNLYDVVPAEWHSEPARRRAMEIVAREFVDGTEHRSHVILLGRRVGWAFGLEGDWCVWEPWAGGLKIGTIPHTSRRNRLYNDQATRERVGRFLRPLFR